MNAKKIISVLTVMVMLLAVFGTVAFADDAKVTFAVPETQIKIGDDIIVPVTATSTVEVDCTSVDINYDDEVLTYAGFTVAGIKESDLSVEKLEDGIVNINAYPGSVMDGTILAYLKFTAVADPVEPFETTLTPAFVEDATFDGEQEMIGEGELAFTAGTLKVVEPHAAPSFDLAIAGDAIVNGEVAANITNEVDNWDLEPTYTYAWTIDGASKGTNSTYTPAAADIGKTLTLTVTATVEAEENATATKTATTTITADPNAAASVANVAISGNAVVGQELTATYDFTASANSGTDASTVAWVKDGQTIANGATYTPVDADDGADITAVVTPKGSLDTAEGTPVSSEAVTVVKTHDAPTFDLAIEGTGEVGTELAANITNFADNWNLEPEFTYSWTIGEDEVSDEETYTPDADVIGETVTLTVTAKVDAEENAESEAKTATIEIKANETATATVENVKLSTDKPKAGTAVKVSYDFTPSVNGGEDESEIEWYNAAPGIDGQEPAALTGKFSEDKKSYTPSSADNTNKVVLGVRVTPKGSLDAETGEPVEKESAEPVAKKKSTGGGGGGASLVPGKDSENNNNNNGAIDTDKFILTIDQKEASVWGVTKVSDMAPLIKNDRTMLPIRFVAENLGFTVGWDEATRTVTIEKGDTKITLVIDSDVATVNGAEVKLDSPAYIEAEAGRTMVPVRFVAENLGYSVDWVETLRQVIITK